MPRRCRGCKMLPVRGHLKSPPATGRRAHATGTMVEMKIPTFPPVLSDRSTSCRRGPSHVYDKLGRNPMEIDGVQGGRGVQPAAQRQRGRRFQLLGRPASRHVQQRLRGSSSPARRRQEGDEIAGHASPAAEIRSVGFSETAAHRPSWLTLSNAPHPRRRRRGRTPRCRSRSTRCTGSWRRRPTCRTAGPPASSPRGCPYARRLHPCRFSRCEHPFGRGAQPTGLFAPTSRPARRFRRAVDAATAPASKCCSTGAGAFPDDPPPASVNGTLTSMPTRARAVPRLEHADRHSAAPRLPICSRQRPVLVRPPRHRRPARRGGLDVYLDYSRQEGEWVPNRFGGRRIDNASAPAQHRGSGASAKHDGRRGRPPGESVAAGQFGGLGFGQGTWGGCTTP